MPTDDWFWAAPLDEPAGDRFIIENGQDALWRRVRTEISPTEVCMWSHIHRTNKGAQIEDILDMMLNVVPTLEVRLNTFLVEAAKIPVFAKFLRDGRHDLCNYVSNPCFPGRGAEPYSDAEMRNLGTIVSRTLGCDENWF